MGGIVSGPASAGPFVVRNLARAAVLALFVSLTAVAGPLTADKACAQEETVASTAAVVVVPAPGEEVTGCAEFNGDQSSDDPGGISGIQALKLAHREVVTRDFGGDLGEAVCKVGEVGDEDCSFSSGYWGYFRSQDAEWEASEVGASQARVHDGDVDAWVFTPADQTEPEPPAGEPELYLEDCAAIGPGGSTTGDTEPAGGISPAVWLIVATLAAVLLIVGIVMARGRARSRGA